MADIFRVFFSFSLSLSFCAFCLRANILNERRRELEEEGERKGGRRDQGREGEREKRKRKKARDRAVYIYN